MAKLPKFVFPIFLTLFFLAAPALIFFASGYRFDSKTGQVSRVGIIIVDGEPRDTHVYLNDELVDTRLPLKQKGVQPGIYDIRLTSGGHHDAWFRRDLRSGESMVISPIFLLLTSIPELVREGSVLSVTPHADRDQFLVEIKHATGKQLFLYHAQQDTWTSLYTTDSLSDWELSFNQDYSKILLQTRGLFRIISLDESPITPLFYKNVAWSKTHGNELFAVDVLGQLVRLSTQDLKTPLVLSDATSLISVAPDYALITRRVGGVDQLARVSFSDEEVTYVDEFRNTAFYADAGESGLFIHDGNVAHHTSNGLEPLVDFDQHRVVWTEESGEHVAYIYNAFEIVRWNPGTQDITAVARYSGDVRAVEPLIGTPYILIARGNELLALNTTETEHQTTVLLRDVLIDHIQSDSKGTTATISGAIGDETGLFSLELRED